MRLIFLDSGSLGRLTSPRGRPQADRCRQWVKDLAAAGVRVFVPEIADYEVRRKLLHIGATAGVGRLDQVKATLDYAPLTTDVMLKAAELWAAARIAGRPTAPPEALDGDCILAAQALLAANPGDAVTVATENVGHLARFVDARLWDRIAPWRGRPERTRGGPPPEPPPRARGTVGLEGLIPARSPKSWYYQINFSREGWN